MADAESLLTPVLDTIAKDEKYEDYKTEISVVNSGGANYTSQLFEITLSAPGKDDLKLFAKVAATSEQLRSMATMQVHETEIIFYTKVFTRYKEYEDKYNFAKEDRLILPKYYGGSAEVMKETIVLEELTSKGFQPFDRFKCFDWEYASKCVSILATLHALSVRYEKDHPKEVDNMLQKLGFKLELGGMKDFMEKRVMSAIEVTADENKGRLGMFLQGLMTEERFMAYLNPKRKVILAHGDFRLSNTMYRRDENGKLEISVIDYQALQKVHPLNDLLYFLISGSDEEFRKQHFDEFFNHYYDKFCRILKQLEINPDDVYTRGDFDEDLKETLPFGILAGIISLPFITVDTESAPKVEDGIGIESFAVDLSELFKIRFNGLVNDYVRMGIL